VAADALAAAAAGAYGAVATPVEGTILTVARESGEAAVAAAAGGGDLVAVLDAARAGGGESLARTPELLPTLAAAGVVDAGGAGFLLLLDAALHVAAGRELPATPAMPEDHLPVGGAATIPAGHATTAGEPRYEVMYFLEADDARVPAFKDAWTRIGESIVVVGGDGLWNCHVHTDDIGAAIEAGIEVGRPTTIRVTDLHEQVEEESWVRAAASAPSTPAGACAVVAVGAGEGVGRLLRSLGACSVVAGGQSMNPSVAELLEAVEATGADQVVVLPNNKNIVPVARQVAGLASRSVVVVPTRGVAEGLAALVAFDDDASAAANGEAMGRALEGIVAGEVTRAVRDATGEAGPIREGDWLGIARDGVKVVAPDLVAAVCGLLDHLVDDRHELVTLIAGDGATPDDTGAVRAWLAAHRPDVELEVHRGDQPLYPYFLSVE
jgi:hypothetical protein